MSLTRCWTSPSIGHNFLLILAITFCLSNVLANNNNNNNNNNYNNSNNYNERGILSSKDFTNVWKDLSNDCTKEEETKNLSVSCQGVRIVRKVVQQFLKNSSKQPDIEIFDGINLVEVKDPNNINTRKGRFLKGFGSMTPLLQFLEGRELRVRLPKLLPADFDTIFENTLTAASSNGEARRGGGGGLGGGGGYGGGGGGGGGKKGGGGMMILALMMGKMLATMGFGALGLLTLKALMVSGLALMLSIIIAVKKLASGGDDGGGHHVVYAQEVGHHHRKKRSFTNEDENNEILDLPYRGYADLYGDVKVS
ncbi:PREDICTED: homeobox protein Wariai-like [Polistes dominula]|uniref:Homeobox protein Wariai-like n=1 Tax=Polistes dominula TaxID=743375 RepID=A0ABM1HZ52_POLDO|nr:PREDICTED: homeobox protein Wariai-like [Polistes dominula]